MNVFKKLRMEAGLGQKDVAKALGYSTNQFVSNWEREVSTPPFKSVKKLASIFGIPAKEIADEIERIKRLNFDKQIKQDRRYLGL